MKTFAWCCAVTSLRWTFDLYFPGRCLAHLRVEKTLKYFVRFNQETGWDTATHPEAPAGVYKWSLLEAHTVNNTLHSHTWMAHSHTRCLCQSPSGRRSSRLAQLLLLCQPELIEPQAERSSAAHISTAQHAKLSEGEQMQHESWITKDSALLFWRELCFFRVIRDTNHSLDNMLSYLSTVLCPPMGWFHSHWVIIVFMIKGIKMMIRALFSFSPQCL